MRCALKRTCETGTQNYLDSSRGVSFIANNSGMKLRLSQMGREDEKMDGYFCANADHFKLQQCHCLGLKVTENVNH